MKIIITVIAALAINAILVIIGRGGFIAVLIPVASAFWIGIPLAVISILVAAISAKRGKQKIAKIGIGGLCVSAVVLSTLISIPFGKQVLLHDKAEAMAFCESIIPELDRIKGKMGLYPKDLTRLNLKRPTPQLLKKHAFYSSDGTNFHFTITNPGTFLGGVDFTSNERRWFSWD